MENKEKYITILKDLFENPDNNFKKYGIAKTPENFYKLQERYLKIIENQTDSYLEKKSQRIKDLNLSEIDELELLLISIELDLNTDEVEELIKKRFIHEHEKIKTHKDLGLRHYKKWCKLFSIEENINFIFSSLEFPKPSKS